MKIYADRIQVERGESWSYDVYFQNRDGSPFIVSSQLQNAYILVTVASSKYTQNGRYIANFWNKVSDGYPTFYSTQVFELTGETIPTPQDGLDGDTKAIILSLADKGVDYSNFCVYKWVDANGEAQYKYWNGVEYEDYDFHFVQAFPTDITQEWIEQSYVFAIKLLGGKLSDNVEETGRPLVTSEGVQVLVAPMQLVVTSNISGSLL